MPREVEINPSDWIVKIRVGSGGAFVHCHLLKERSQKLAADIKAGWKGLILKYVSCLYGQSMTTKLDYDDEKVVCETSDFSVQIHTLSVLKDDYDPADTSIDHIQAFIGSYSSCIEYPFLCPTDERKLDFNSPRGRLMVEFILYGDDGLNMKHWIDAHDRTCSEEDAGALGEVLSKKLAEEAEGKRAGREQPELTDKSERCRYHLHKEKGLPCYLDKQ